MLGDSRMRVVAHSPRRRVLVMLGFIAVCVIGIAGGYRVGTSKADLDQIYMGALVELKRANEAELDQLNSLMVEANLNREVDRQAAQELRQTIKGLRDELAALNEEVTFYKSVMSPSSIARGLQIAEFDLATTDSNNQYTFHLLLTQVETRRDWIQGSVDFTVQGVIRTAESAAGNAEQVLSLTEIGGADSYPLKFRFRYFQDLTGVITLPEGFEPQSVVVTALKRGANTAGLSRSFDWKTSG